MTACLANPRACTPMAAFTGTPAGTGSETGGRTIYATQWHNGAR